MVCSVGMEWVWLVLSALGTIQGTSTDSGVAWPCTSSNSVIVRVGISVIANIRHAVCFSRRREFIRVAITTSAMAARAISVFVVKVGVMRSGSGFRGGKCYVLIEPFRTATADDRRDNENQYSESDESYHAESAGDGSSIVKEAFAGVVGAHDASG